MLAMQRIVIAASLALLLTACINTGDRRQPIPTQTFAGAAPSKILVVVLPGRWDDVQDMAQAGMPEAIRGAWPEADVMLTGAAMAYYTDGGLAQRLHEQIIVPAKERGYREIWMVGASLGGMGTLLYDRQYPGELQGLVLLAPYLGDRGILKAISKAGGIANWQPGPVPQAIDKNNFQNEIWRYLQTWQDQPERAQRVWLAYGDQDRLRNAVPLIAPLLLEQQVLERPGGHAWDVWVPAAAEVFAAVAERRVKDSGT